MADFTPANAPLAGLDNQTVKIPDPIKGLTPVLVVGGDHPYLQWWGTNGLDGMAAMYAYYGITPYLAVNTTAVTNEAPSPGVNADFCSWEQTTALSTNLGVDVVSHGNRHIQDWRKINAGMTIRYSGAAATATVQVTATNVIGVTAGSVNDFNFDITTAPYDTLAELVAAINAVTGWSAVLCDSLTGSESSLSMMIIAATSCKSVTQPFACAGGVYISYSAAVYSNVTYICDGTILRIYADGVRVYSITLSGKTLANLVTEITAVSGFTCVLCNDAPNTNGINYVSGSELASSFRAFTGEWKIPPQGLYVHGLIPPTYLVRRELDLSQTRLAARGITVRNFAQSGSNFFAQQVAGQDYLVYRGNGAFQTYAPGAVPTGRIEQFLPHITVNFANYPTAAYLTAIIDALVDSPGYTATLLCHKLLPDSDPRFPGIVTSVLTDYDQVKTNWLTFLAYAQAAIQAKTLKNMSISDIASNMTEMKMPRNRFFNAKFKNFGGSLLGISGDGGYRIPGWQVSTSANITAISVSSDGTMSVTTSSGTAVTPVNQIVMLEPGQYEATLNVNCTNYSSGNGVQFRFDSMLGTHVDEMVPNNTQMTSSSGIRYQGQLKMSFVVKPPEMLPGQVASLSTSPWDLSVNKNIKLNINSLAQVEIDCSAGAVSAAATTAKEVAAAINNFLAANATYGPKAEYHTVARAANGRVYITNPYFGPDASYAVNLASGATADAMTTIFGQTSANSITRAPNNDYRGGLIPVKINILIGMAAGTVTEISRPWLRKIVEDV